MNFDNFNSFSELPLTLNVADISTIMGISKSKAYELCHRKGFPCVQVGRRMIIPTPAFKSWMENPQIF